MQSAAVMQSQAGQRGGAMALKGKKAECLGTLTCYGLLRGAQAGLQTILWT